MDPFTERYEELRAAYRTRLAGELSALRALAKRLALTESAPAAEPALIEEIRQMAHRMAGAAGMFEAASIADAAGLLEDAAAPPRESADGFWRDGLRGALDHLMRQIEASGAG